MSSNYLKKYESRILFSEKQKNKILENSLSSIGTNTSSASKKSMLKSISKDYTKLKFHPNDNLIRGHRRSLSSNNINSISDIISFLFDYEYDKIKPNILKFLINKEQMDQIAIKSFRKVQNDTFQVLKIDTNDNSLGNRFKENKVLSVLQQQHDKFRDKLYFETNIIKNTIYSRYYLKSSSISLLRKLPILTNYKKHCFKCSSSAKHNCKNYIYIIPDSNYVICKYCEEIYPKDNIECYCDYDKCVFISQEYNSISKEEQFFPITHKDNIENEIIKCEACNNSIEMNMKNGNLYCNKCDIKYSNDINAVVYNLNNFEKLNKEIKYVLLMKSKNDENENDNKNCDCGGNLYKGNFNLKDILVCEKCHKIQFYKNNSISKFSLNKINTNNKLNLIHSTDNIFKNIIIKKKDNSDNHNEKKATIIYQKIPPLDPKNLVSKRRSVIMGQKTNEYTKKSTINNLNRNVVRDTQKLRQRIEQKPIHPVNNSMNINELIFSKKNNINLNNSNINNNIDVTKINKSLNYKIIKEYNTKISSDLNMSDYQIISMIGSGSFANIYLVSEIKTKKKYAIKKIIADGEEDLKKFKSTIEIIQTLCPNNNIYNNIIPILKYVIKKIDATAYSIYILMPLASSDWYKTIQDNTIIYDEKTLRTILNSLVKALSYMQENKISHRDIKPQNILILENQNYCIADFDESIYVKNDFGTFDIRGTEMYMSPLLKNLIGTGDTNVKHNVYKSDVYSLGLCFVYAITKNLENLNNIRKYGKDENIKSFLIKNTVLKRGYSDEFYNILVKMLSINERNRVDFIQLRNIIYKD